MQFNRYIKSLVLALTFSSYTFGQSIAFTFDDGPKVENDSRIKPSERNTLLLQQLKEYGIKSALFISLRDTHDDGLALARKWGEDGHMIGNQTVNHTSLSSKKATLQSFKQELLGCDSIIRNMPGYSKRFRFPYLKEGDTKAKRDGFRVFMKSIGYQPAPVSVDASDWYYNSRLLSRLRDNPALNVEPYRKAYLNHIWDRAYYYDSLSRQVLGRSVKHVLLLHHNTINAMFLGDIIRMFQEKGWQVIDAKTAFQDPVYKMEPKILPAGESIIWGLAKEKKLMNRAFRTEFKNTQSKVVLLPGCMRGHSNEECKATRVEEGLFCEGCLPRCHVYQIREMGKKHNFKVYVIPHASDLSLWSPQKSQISRGVIASACVTTLVEGGWELKRYDVPAQCILLDYSGCKKHWHCTGISTDLDIRELKRILN